MKMPMIGVFISFTFMCSVVAYMNRKLLTSMTIMIKIREANAIVRALCVSFI